jgi:hypothetical protein
MIKQRGSLLGVIGRECADLTGRYLLSLGSGLKPPKSKGKGRQPQNSKPTSLEAQYIQLKVY